MKRRLTRKAGRWTVFSRGIVASIFPVAGLSAEQPEWAGEEGTSRQVYRFTSENAEPLPETLNNPHGSPDASVLVTEPFGSGWQDPSDPFSLSGVEEDGAWDLGPQGNITVSVPFAEEAPANGGSHQLEFFVRFVAYETPVALPVVEMPGGLVLEDEEMDTTIVKQEDLGRYVATTWSAVTDVADANETTFVFAATDDGALIDLLDIHTRLLSADDSLQGFEGWANEAYPDSDDLAVTGFNAAPEGDGIPNGVKYFLGRQPGNSGPVTVPVNSGSNNFTFTHTRNKKSTDDVEAAYEWSTNLRQWHGEGASADGVSVSFSSAVSEQSDEDFDVITVTANGSPSMPGSLFVRLKVGKVKAE